ERLHATLDLEHGPLVRAAWFDYGDAEPALLMLVAHHLVIDAVSWSVVLEDLADFYEQLAEGRELSYPAKTTSVKWWASRLAEYAQSPLLRRELDYWLAAVPAEMPALPVDRDDGPPTFAAAEMLSTHIDGVPHQQDALLAALALAVAEWTGHDGTLVELEGHGREELFDGANLFATVGWFTTLTPVLLPVAAGT